MAGSSTSPVASAAPSRTRGQLTAEQIHGIDVAVGAQTKLRRVFLGLSQSTVSNIIGLTYQQLHKYEQGTNRIGASRLYRLSLILHVPVSYFFETVDFEVGAETARKAYEVSDLQNMEGIPSDLLKKRKTVQLIRTFYAIEDERQRAAAFKLVKTLAKAASK